MPLSRDAWTAFRHIGGLLVKRGTAMGPLVPSLLLCPMFVGAAWLFRSVAVTWGVPLFSAVFVLVAVGIVFSYHRHYASFAKRDPDRLQSEEYRYETARMQMIAAKELRHPVPADSLPLADSTENPVERSLRANREGTPELPGTEDERDS